MCPSLPSVRRLREELQLLQEQGSHVGEVIKPMDKKKVLVKVSSRESYKDVWNTPLSVLLTLTSSLLSLSPSLTPSLSFSLSLTPFLSPSQVHPDGGESA